MSEEQRKQPIPPAQEEIDETYDLIVEKLDHPLIDRKENESVKFGFEFVLDILDGKKKESDISELKTIQARAIASLTFDYLKGLISQKNFIGVPLKGGGIKPTIN
ncbi:hypothetical protein [Emticicia sp. BO119]|uniref:hypothetical protein n=1 Tax=Emticicia sp. BO119 TaxID=2757768 RepID=UPI0015F05597|nr:hypothetical protein [Emticicia sp. BO119]MBA4852064.1 hypothetical protein [Emticicia sp. BO119]